MTTEVNHYNAMAMNEHDYDNPYIIGQHNQLILPDRALRVLGEGVVGVIDFRTSDSEIMLSDRS